MKKIPLRKFKITIHKINSTKPIVCTIKAFSDYHAMMEAMERYGYDGLMEVNCVIIKEVK